MTARRDLAYTTRRFSFAAAHRYHVEGWSAEENRRAFGELGGVHGHNYTLDVTIRGPIDPETGMVIDLGELKRIIGETVVERFDHADLNADPWELLAPKLGVDRLWQVRVWEDPTLYVDYRGA